MKGVDLYAEGKQLGHHSLDMNKKYAHLARNYAVEVLAFPSAQVTPAVNDNIPAPASPSFQMTRP